MNIAQLSEQLKDVPQNRLVDYAKNPNSVVPQFLALAEIQRRQQLSAQAQPPQSTVANDVLSQATAPQMMPQMVQQLPENQPGVAQLPSGMPQGFAPGGLVAFADGGLSDDEDEDKEMEQLFPRKSGVNVEELIAGLKGLAGKMPQSYTAEKTKAQGIPSLASPKGSHPYESVALEEAKRLGVDPSLVRHVLHKETGGHRDPATARSKAGAYGPMQLMPGTAKDLGVDLRNPEENTRGGVRYLAQMMERFKDPTLALAAYNAGPGRVQEMLKRGRGIESLTPETQKYVKFDKGGVIGMADGGETNPYAMMGDIGASEPNYGADTNFGIGDYLKRKIMGIQDVPATPAGPSAKDLQQFDQASALFQAENAAKAPKPVAQPEAPVQVQAQQQLQEDAQKIVKETGATPASKTKSEEYFDLLSQDIERRAAEAKANGNDDMYLAIMQAGLSMMAGSSPYALQNIGAGGAKGIETYAALRKQQSDVAKDIMNARLGMAKYKAAEEGAAETRETNKLLRQAAMSQKGTEFATEQERKRQETTSKEEDRAYLRLGQRTKEIEESVRSAYAKNPMYQIDPTKFEAEIQAKIAQLKRSDSLYNQLYKRAGMGEPMAPIAPPITQPGWSIKPKQ